MENKPPPKVSQSKTVEKSLESEESLAVTVEKLKQTLIKRDSLITTLRTKLQQSETSAKKIASSTVAEAVSAVRSLPPVQAKKRATGVSASVKTSVPLQKKAAPTPAPRLGKRSISNISSSIKPVLTCRK